MDTNTTTVVRGEELMQDQGSRESVNSMPALLVRHRNDRDNTSSPTGTVGTLPPRPRTVQVIYQLSSMLGSKVFPNAAKRFEEARSLALWWMNRRLRNELGRGIPPPAWEGQPFEIDQHRQRYAAVSVEDLDLWTCRLEHDDPNVPARTWCVDLALRRVGSEVIMVIRTLCVSPSTSVHPVPLSVPRIIRDVLTRIGLIDGLPLSAKPWELTTVADLETLEILLSDSSRALPVVMLTEASPDTRERSYRVNRFVLDPSTLAADLMGLAHVVAIPRGIGFQWTSRVGKTWSAFNGAVRTYRTGLSFSNDDPYRHPLAKLDDIVLREYEGVLSPQKLYGEAAYQAFLREKLFQVAASKPFRQEDTLFFRYAKVQALSSATARQAGSSPIEEELRLEVGELRKQLEEERGEKDFAYSYSAELEENVQRLEKERFSLRSQLELLRAGLGQEARTKIPLPESLDDLEDWQENVAGQLWLAPKAIGAATKSEFRDPRVVFEGLLLLAHEYRQMRIHGGLERKRAYEDGLKKLKLTEGRSISESRVGEQGQEYYVNHPFQPNKRILLEDHLRRGNDRDPRNTLRIYFAWEPQEQLVIVGWLPSHLATRNS